MRALIKDNLIEALIGAVVLLVAAWFVVFAYQRTSGAGSGGDYTVTARFPNVSGVAVLRLVVTDGGDGPNFDHADWADAKVVCSP